MDEKKDKKVEKGQKSRAEGSDVNPSKNTQILMGDWRLLIADW